MPANIKVPDIRDGDQCTVLEGRHKGKSGLVEDFKIAKSGHATISVKQADGTKFKTLAKAVRRDNARAD